MILIIYGAGALKEYMLPRRMEDICTIGISGKEFGLAEEFSLMLEASAGIWTLKKGEGYFLYQKGEERKEIPLNGSMHLTLVTESGESLRLLVEEDYCAFPVFKKYDIRFMREIFVGRDEENYISYMFQDWISHTHAVLRRGNDGVYIEDVSANGIFCRGKKISGSQRLEFGDEVNIFGLHLVYLEDVLAVGTCYGKLRVREDILCPARGEEGEPYTGIYQEQMYFSRSPRTLPYIHRGTVEIEGPPNLPQKKERPLYLTIGPAFTMAIPMLLGSLMAILGARAAGRASSAFMYTGLITAVSSALLGTVWALLNARHAREEAEEEEHKRFNAYGNYLIECADRIKKEYEDNQKALLSMYPHASVCCSYGISEAALWSRNETHEDFLFVRLGLGDIPFQVPIQIPKEKFSLIEDSLREKPGMIREEYKVLKNVPVGINLLEKPLVGLVGGPERRGAISVMQLIAAQIGANNCYTDVKMAFLYQDKREKEKWEAAKWLPHVWSQDGKTRYLASNMVEASDVFYELASIFRHRAENAQGDGRRSVLSPHYVIFLESASMLEGELLAKYVLEPQKEYGLTTFILADTWQELPNACEDVIQYDGSFAGMFNGMDTAGERMAVQFDRLDTRELQNLSKRLAPVRVGELENSQEIPAGIDFLSMYHAGTLEELKVPERWKGNRTYQSMRALIGKKAGDKDCYLDIHEKYHGPHGLVAGTTGSGKSELLQTYILSMALNFSPDDVAFFLIDFKGGGMANLFDSLPHMAGKITNLSGNQIRRAMISIKSENMRRQRIFQEYGVNNINSYTRLYKSQEAEQAIPHLLIMIDEFAELRKEEPEFMQELISVAQVGRSLGVHLILATQKPGGIVSENIRSNTKFKLCLRVQDRKDSIEMLHKPDAAYLSQAGRCYLQVGNDELYELLQSGYSGAIYDEALQKSSGFVAAMLTTTGKEAIVGNRTMMKKMEEEKKKWYIWMVGLARRGILKETLEKEERQVNQSAIDNFLSLWPEGDGGMSDEEIAVYISRKALLNQKKLPEKQQLTQLEAVVLYLREEAKKLGYTRRLKLWLPPLKKKIYLSELPGFEKEMFRDGKWQSHRQQLSLETYVGLMDDPENQAQIPLTTNLLADGHLAVMGAVASGKSTFLQTFIYSLTCRYTPENVHLYLLDFGSRMLEPFSEMPHVGGIVFENQPEKLSRFFYLLQRMTEERRKILQGGTFQQYLQAFGWTMPAVVVVIDSFAGFCDKTGGRYEETLVRLAREGAGYGIYLVVTAGGFGANELPGRIGSHIRTTLALEMGDKYKYLDVLRTSRIDILPENDCKGRGLTNTGNRILEFQTALSVQAEDDYERGNKIRSMAGEMAHVWTGSRAKVIPEIPEEPTLVLLSENQDYKAMIQNPRYLPFAYCVEDAAVYGMDLYRSFCYLLSGKSHSGKTNILKLLMYGAVQKRGQIVVVEQNKSELKFLTEKYGGRYLSEDKELFDFLQEFSPEVSRRNKRMRELREQGKEGLELFTQMSRETPVFFFVDDLAAFFQTAYHPKAGVGVMGPFFEMLMGKGSMHGMYFIGCLGTEDYAKVIGYAAFKHFVSEKMGLHLGGMLTLQKVFSFQNLSAGELAKPMKKGLALAASAEDETAGVKLVIPLAEKQK